VPNVVAGGSSAASVGGAPTAPGGPAASGAPAASEASGAVVATPRRHTVATGESLWRIARRYGVTVGHLLTVNGIDAGRLIAPGTVLAIDALPRP
jgi:LysM repeat protein